MSEKISHILTPACAFIHSSIEQPLHKDEIKKYLNTNPLTASPVFIKPFAFVDKSPPRFNGKDGDSMLYSVVNFLKQFGLAIKYIEEKNLQWEQVKKLYYELSQYLDDEKEEFPVQEDVCSRQLSGIWRLMILSRYQNTQDDSLLAMLNRMKGRAIFSPGNDETVHTIGNLSFLSLRRTFGDIEQNKEYDHDKHGHRTTFHPVRYGVLHVPNDQKDEMRILDEWMNI